MKKFKRKFTRKGAWNLMKPSKTTAAKRPAKRKKGIPDNPILDKLLQLKYRINDYREIHGNTDRTKTSKKAVFIMLEDVRGGVILSKLQMEQANALWRMYEG